MASCCLLEAYHLPFSAVFLLVRHGSTAFFFSTKVGWHNLRSELGITLVTTIDLTVHLINSPQLMPFTRSASPQLAPVNLENSDEARAEVARLKRCLATSQDELVEATNAKRKKPP
jgi:hypothetical protein